MTPAQLLNIEVVNVAQLDTANETTLNLTNAASVTNVNNASSTGALVVSNIAGGADLAVTNVASDTTTFAYKATAVTGSADSANLTINNVTGADAARIRVGSIETLNVTATGTASVVELSAADATAMTFAGDVAQTITLNADTTKVNSFDATNATAAVTLNIGNQTLQGTNTKISVTGGFGNDVFTISSEDNPVVAVMGGGNDTLDAGGIVSGDSFVGGLGTDTIKLSSTIGTTTLANQVYGFETISSTADQNLAVFGNSTFTTANNTAGTVAFTNAAATLATLGAADGTTTTLSRAVDTTADGLTIALNATGAAGITAARVNANDEESITIATNRTSTATGAALKTNSLTRLDASDLTSLTVTGTENLGATEVVGATNLASVTTTGLVGSLNLDVSDSTVNLTANLGNGASTLTSGTGNDVLNGGNGNDVIYGGAGNDTITAGAGADAIWGEAGSNVLNGGDGNDSIYAGTGNDSITAGGGSDKIYFGTAANNGSLTADVTIVGDGTDTLLLGEDSNSLDDVDFTNVSGIQTVTASGDAISLTLALGAEADASGLSAVTQTTSTTTYTGAIAIVADSDFNNALTVTAGSGGVDVDLSLTTAALTLNVIDANLDADDTIIGGTGTSDTINITASGSTAFFDNVSGIESVAIVASTTPTQGTTIDATGYAQAANKSMSIDATALTLGDAAFNLINTDNSAVLGSISVNSGAGADTIYGGAGNDSIYGNSGNDTVYGQDGKDYISGGNGADKLYGGAGNDTIDGGSGNDSIDGGAGNDAIISGTGVDSIFGGAGGDSIDLSAGGVKNVEYTAVSQSYLRTGQSTDAAAVALVDTITAFDFGTTSATQSKFYIPVKTADMTIGTYTLATGTLKTLGATLEADTNFNNLFNAGQSDAVVLTVTAGSAAGTYLVVNQDGTGGFAADSDLFIKLVNPLNTSSIATSNFVGQAASLSGTYTVGTTTLALTGTPVGQIGIDLDTALLVTDSGFDVSITGSADYVSSAINTIALGGVADDAVIGITAYSDTAALTVTADAAQAVTLTMTQDNTTALTGTIAGVDSVVLNTGVDVTMLSANNAKLTAAAGTNTVTFSNAASAVALNANVETYVLAAATNSVTLGAAAQNVTGSTGDDTVSIGAVTATGTVALAAGTNAVSLASGASLAGATVSVSGGGTWALTLADNASVTLRTANLTGGNATSGISAGATETVTVNTTGAALTSYTLDGDVETWNVGTTGNLNNSVTLGGAAQSVTFGTGNDTLTTGTPDTLTGTLNGGSGTNTIVFEDGDNLSGATISNFGVLSTDTTAAAVAFSLTGNQWNSIASKVLSAGANAVTTTFTAVADASVVLDADYTKYVLANGTNSIDATAAANYSITGGTGADTIAFAATLTADDTVAGGSGSDTITVTGAATGSANLGGVDVFTIGYASAATFTTGAINTVATTGTAFNASTSTAAVTWDASLMTDTDAYSFTDGSAADVITLSTTDASRGVTTVNLTNGGADKVTINNAATASAVNTYATITGFTAGIGGDQVQAKLDTAALNNGFQSNTTGGGTPATITVADASILEVGTAVGQLVNVSALDAIALANAGFTSGLVTTDENYLVVIYGNNNAYLFEMKYEADTDVFDAAELVGVLTNVTGDALVANNFF